MPTICKIIGCNTPIFSGGLCLHHYKIKRALEPTLKQSDKRVNKPYRVKPMSDKHKKLMATYLTLRGVYLKNYPICEAQLDGCTNYSTQIHHKKGRGEYLLDSTTFLACCENCHHWIELHPTKAKELGLSLNRLDK